MDISPWVLRIFFCFEIPHFLTITWRAVHAGFDSALYSWRVLIGYLYINLESLLLLVNVHDINAHTFFKACTVGRCLAELFLSNCL